MTKYVGPINWDIGDHMGPEQAADWDCWTRVDGARAHPQQCGDRYVNEIDRVGRGIVLLHDPYFVDDDPAQGGTVDMVKYIVPILRRRATRSSASTRSLISPRSCPALPRRRRRCAAPASPADASAAARTRHHGAARVGLARRSTPRSRALRLDVLDPARARTA